MSDLHKGKTTSVTQEYSTRLEKATLQSGAHLAAGQGWAPIGQGRPPHHLHQQGATSWILPPPPLWSNLDNLSRLVRSEGCGAT
jgi:hypothetical protein